MPKSRNGTVLKNTVFFFIIYPDLEEVIHAFISSQLDYCNCMYSCLSQSSLSRLQLVQNAAAGILTNSRKSDNITPILASLHWLSVHFRIVLKIWLICSIIHLWTPHPLWADWQSLDSRSRLVTTGDRAFAVKATCLWNVWPEELRLTTSVSTFMFLLKTHLFR